MFTSFMHGRYRVYRRRGKRFTDQCVYEFDRFGGGSDGRIKFKIVQETLNAVKYRDGILDHIVLPLLQHRNFDNVFQRDNAGCHVARVYQDFLNQNYISVLPWRHYYRICHQLNNYGMNSLYVFATSKSTGNATWAAWRTCARLKQHRTSLYAPIGYMHWRSCRCCKRWSRMLLKSANFHTARQFMSVHDMFR